MYVSSVVSSQPRIPHEMGPSVLIGVIVAALLIFGIIWLIDSWLHPSK